MKKVMTGNEAIARGAFEAGGKVAADPLMALSYVGVNGGLVLVSCDDPELYSSQNEQDNRHYARFAKIPMFEPSDSEEAKEFLKLGFEVSEPFDAPNHD